MGRPMKVLEIANVDFSLRHFVLPLMRGLRERGHEVRIFAPRHPQEPAREEGVYRLNSSFAGARALGGPADYPVMLAPGPLLTSRLPLRDLDVLHTMHPFLAGGLALRWGRLSGAPVVYTAHTQYDQYLHYAPMPVHVSRAVVRPHVAAFARRAQRVLAPGRAMTISSMKRPHIVPRAS